MATTRSPRQVLDDHLTLAQAETWALESDLARNFSKQIVLLTSFGVYRGWDGVREKASLLRQQLPGGRWTYKQVLVEGDLGFLEWTAEAENGARVEDGADSYLIRDDRIQIMTIHYTVLPAPPGGAP